MMGQQLQHFEAQQQAKFPMECTQIIFSYLKLVDCIRFASTSSLSLREVLPTIRLRHDRMLKTYGVFAITTPPRQRQTTIQSKLDLQIGVVDDERQKSANHKECKLLYEFPRLQQRVAQLATKIPYTHPMFETVVQLNKSLRSASCSTNDHARISLSSSSSSTSFDFDDTPNLIILLQQYILPLKLHATILYNTVLSNHCYNDTSTSTTLQNYIGDVLCVTYLLYDFSCETAEQPYSCYAEHSITTQWLNDKLQIYVPTVYQSWVLMHAGILRTRSFTQPQQLRLGLLSSPTNFSATATNYCFQYIDTMNTLIISPDSFVHRPSSSITTLSSLGWDVGIVPIRTDQFVKSEMCVVYDDFGPLGPTFRGRDIVQVRDVTADAMTECQLLHHPTLSNPSETSSNINININNNNSIREAIEWICIAHEQAYKSRPMSVRIPMIRFN